MKKILVVLIGLLIAAGAVFGAGLVVFNRLNGPTELLEKGSKRFEVEKGSSLTDIAEDLKREDLIRSIRLMRIAAKVMEND